MITAISDFVTLAKSHPGSGSAKLAIIAPHDASTVDAACAAIRAGICTVKMYGDARLADPLIPNDMKSAIEVVHAPDIMDALSLAVCDIKSGECTALMKGSIETAPFLHAVIMPENDLRGSGRLSAIGFYDPKQYHKLIAVTDFGMNLTPDADAKAEIIGNAVGLLKQLGVDKPKVAVLADTERENKRVPASRDAAELKRRWETGGIPDCILEGPIAFDLAVDRAAAEGKKMSSPVAGDADILVVPDIAAGNILVKAMTLWGGMHTAGTILGAKIPVIMTSRSAPSDDKFYSIALAFAAARGE